MNDERQREEAIFDAALEIEDRDERARFLDDACEGDCELRQSVASLLDCDDTSGDFLETPAVAFRTAHDHQPDDRIDEYQLRQRLGEGGFGVVWRAEQVEPVNRSVALKILKLGMDSEQIIERFDTERQALARMKHRHIATVLDAGQTRQGRPYVVMELIDGKPIDVHCDEHRFTIPERLALFVEICGAVQHAHQKGIVHQDLKPTNLLITLENDRAVPKVIDFGIAKAVDASQPHHRSADARRPEAGGNTSIQLVGTPDYMSPEQILRHRDVDTRADVYSLGAVLYHLLTGKAPTDRNWLRSLEPGQWADRLASTAIPAPSTRLATLGDAHGIASQRRTTASQLKRQLREDLDWITQKALADEPSDRYDSAAELARDVERYLEGRPVAAAPASGIYLAKRFAVRHRVGMFAALAVLAAVILGVSAAGVGFLHARRERDRATTEWRRAEREKQNAELERNLANDLREKAEREAEKAMRFAVVIEDLIGAADPAHGFPADYTVRENLDRIAADVGDRLAEYPLIEARLRSLIGRVYYSLREFRKAEPQLRLALELTIDAAGSHDERALKREADHAGALFFVGRASEAAATLDSLLPRLRELEPSWERINALYVMSRIEGLLDRRESSAFFLQEAWQSSVDFFGAEHPTTLRYQAQAARRLLGNAPDRAESQVREVYQKMVEARGTSHADVAFALHQLAFVLSSAEKHSEADERIVEATEMYRELLGETNPNLMAMLSLRSKIKSDLGDDTEGLRLAREAVQLADSIGDENPTGQRNAYQRLAVVARSFDPAEALAARGKSLEIQVRYFPHDRKLMYSLAEFAFRLRRAGRNEEALQAYETAISSMQSFGGADFQLVRVLHAAGDFYRELGDHPKAIECFLDAIRRSKDALARSGSRANLERAVLEIELADALLRDDRVDVVNDRIKTLRELETKAPALGLAVQVIQSQKLLVNGHPKRARRICGDSLEQFATTYSNRMSMRLTARVRSFLAQCHLAADDFESCEAELLACEKETGLRFYRPADRRRIRGQLVALYEAWGNDDQATYWKQLMGRIETP